MCRPISEIYFFFVLGLILVLGIPLSQRFLFSPLKSSEAPLSIPVEKNGASLSYPELGPYLCSEENFLSFLPIPNLKEELRLYLLQARPDAPSPEYLLQIPSSQEKKRISKKERIDLAYGKEGKLHLSPEPSLLWMEVEEKQQNLWVELHLEGLPASMEKTQCFLMPKTPFSGSFSPSILSKTQKMRFLGKDLLQEKWGKTHYVFEQEGSTFSIDKEALWVWDQKHWREKKEGEDTKRHYIAKLDKTFSEKIYLQLWSPEGSSQRVCLSLHPAPSIKVSLAEVVHSIKPKMLTKIALIQGKKSLILRAGEAGIKTAKGWKKAENLSSPPSGEIFLFHSLEIQGDKKILSAELFDATHTVKQILKAPLDPQALSETKGHLLKEGMGS